jgi:hypothetical protein
MGRHGLPLIASCCVLLRALDIHHQMADGAFGISLHEEPRCHSVDKPAFGSRLMEHSHDYTERQPFCHRAARPTIDRSWCYPKVGKALQLLALAETNIPFAVDEAARKRFECYNDVQT